MILGLAIAILAASSLLRKYQVAAVILASLILTYVGTFSGDNGLKIPDYPCIYWCTYVDPLQKTSIEYGYKYLAEFFYGIGVPYPFFRFGYIFITFGILAWGMYRFTKNIAFPFLLWTIACFFIDAIQLRSSLASALVVLAFSFLKRKTVLNYVVAIAIIYFSTFFHEQSLFFIPLALLTLVPLKHMWKISVLSVIFFFTTFAYKPFFLESVWWLVSKFSTRIKAGSRVWMYQEGASTTTIIFATMIFIVVLAVYYFYTYSDVLSGTFEKNRSIESGKTNNSQNVLGTMILMSPVTIPMMLISLNYVRFSRPLIVFFFIWVAIVLSEKLEPMRVPVFFARNKQLLITIAVIVALCMFALQVMISLTSWPGYFLTTPLPFTFDMLQPPVRN